jgi:hypothetical protein
MDWRMSQSDAERQGVPPIRVCGAGSLGNQIFIKHDLKGVLKCIRVKICTHHPPPPQTMTDIFNWYLVSI